MINLVTYFVADKYAWAKDLNSNTIGARSLVHCLTQESSGAFVSVFPSFSERLKVVKGTKVSTVLSTLCRSPWGVLGRYSG